MQGNNILVGRLALDLSVLQQNVNSANGILSQIGQNAAKNVNDLSVALQNLSKQMQNTPGNKGGGRSGNSNNQANDAVRKMAAAYRDLTTAQREYNRSEKAGNGLSGYWQSRINASRQILTNIQQQANSLGLNADQMQRINDLAQRANNAQDLFNQNLSQGNSATEALADNFDKIWGKLKMIAGLSLTKMFYDAYKYAMDFDKAITDIAIITQTSIEDARALGDEYRGLASDLNVASTEIAKAAATIYRQGYTDKGDVEGIITGVTKFGAVTDLSTDQAIKYMTASMQNFRKESESAEEVVARIGDTWSYMGDAVATEGADIATAMDKASASLSSVGVEFERASAYAAILLAKTQQTGEVIGTQLNSLASRYQKVTSKGYSKITSDDEGEALSFNDISKALSTAGIEMYDVATKTFLPMQDMLDQLSEKWQNLNQAQQAYIATAIGGTRGMNYFLTLMQNYSDAVALQQDAMNNRGVVDEKYQAWLEGAEAAQNDLKNSLEELYSVLSADVITGFYHKMADLVDVFTAGTKAVDGWNLKIPLIASGVLFAVSAIAKLIVALREAKAAFAKMNAAGGIANFLSGGTVGLVVAGLTALVTVVGVVISKVREANGATSDWEQKLSELNQQIEEKGNLADKYQSFADQLKDMGDITDTTNISTEEFIALRKQIVSDSPSLQAIYGQEGEAIVSLAEAYEIVTEKANEAKEATWSAIILSQSENQSGYENAVSKFIGNNRNASSLIDALFNDDDYKALATSPNIINRFVGKFGKAVGIKGNATVTSYDEVIDNLREVVSSYSISELNAILTELRNNYDIANEAGATDSAQLWADMAAIVQAQIISASEEIETAKRDYLIPALSSVFTDPDQYNELLSESDSMMNRLFESIVSSDWVPSGEEIESLKNNVRTIANALVGENSVVGQSFWESVKELEKNGVDTSAVDGIISLYESALQKAAENADYSFMQMIADGVDKKILMAYNAMSFDGLDPQHIGDSVAQLSPDQQLTWAMNILTSVNLVDENGNVIDPADKAEEVIEDAQKTASSILSDYDKLKTYGGAVDKITLGEFDSSDLEKLIKNYPEVEQYATNMIDLANYLRTEMDNLMSGNLDEFKAMGLDTSDFDEIKSYGELIGDLVAPANSAQKAIEKLTKGQKLSSDEISALIKDYPELTRDVLDYASGAKDAKKMIDALNKAQNEKNVNAWRTAMSKALNTLNSATKGTSEYTDALTEIGDLMGGEFGNMSSLEFATQNLDNIKAAANGSADAFRALQEAAWVNIIGTSSVDFSNIMNGIALVGEDANRLGSVLAALGLFTIETKHLTGTQQVLTSMDGFGGFTTKTMTLDSTYQILKPAAQNPFKSAGSGGTKKSGGSGGGGGKGGGGGSGKVSVSDSTQNLVDSMKKNSETQDNLLKLIDLKKEYHDIRGEIQGVIGYTKLEAETITSYNKTLEENIAKLEAEMKAKEATLASSKKNSKAYKQASVDLDELNEAHQDYSEKLLENRNRLEEIRKELEEFKENARQTTINVQDLIRDTLQAYDESQRDILDSTVSLEDEILEIIKVRYEKEQELAIETAEKKKEALQDEIDKIDELIDARKKLIDAEEKQNEIAELEAKIARIAADPTRQKEMLKLQEELAEKRKDLAWDQYEEEMNAQKDALEKESESLDDYIESVNKYYEELFKNPKKLIAEMKEIISKSDSEIIEWLTKNQEDFASYTENKKKQTIEDWQDMINAMRGVTETYYDQIKEIMSMSDEEIIAWLKKYNVEFQTSTKEQQDAFIYSWKNTLEEWRNAYKNVATDISSYNYQTGNSGSGGGGGGGGSSGGGGGGYGGISGGSTGVGSGAGIGAVAGALAGLNRTSSWRKTAVYKWKDVNGKWHNVSYTANSTKSEADAIDVARANAFKYAKQYATADWSKVTGFKKVVANAVLKLLGAATAKYPGTYMKFVKAYKEGGLNTTTGFAWLDGTKSRPERILSGYQTELFEDLLSTLHEIRRFNISGLSGYKAPSLNGSAGGMNIDSVQINVNRLESDQDYDEMAERVCEVIKEKMVQTMPVGGLTIR